MQPDSCPTASPEGVALAARLERHDSMRAFERFAGRLWVVVTPMAAIAMTVVICRTAHLLG